MSKHVANEKQVASFKAIVKAIKAANKIGLVFYAKSDNLVAYTKEADHYIENEHGFDTCLRGKGGQIPKLTASILADSGADDYPSYVTKEDDSKFNPNDY